MLEMSGNRIIQTLPILERIQAISYPLAMVRSRIEGYPYPISSFEWRDVCHSLEQVLKLAVETCEACEQLEKEMER